METLGQQRDDRTHLDSEVLEVNENHIFSVDGKKYIFVVHHSAIFEIDDITSEILTSFSEKTYTAGNMRSLYSHDEVKTAIDELKKSEVLILPEQGKRHEKEENISLLSSLPVVSLTCNISHACNLKCKYCYADNGLYGGKEMLMSEKMAQKYVEFLLNNSGNVREVHFCFFGGEPLLNFSVVQSTVEYGKRCAKSLGKRINFGLTTNGTLLTHEITDFLIKENISVSISIDGSSEINDRFRVYPDGKGTYDTIIERVGSLIKQRTTPVHVTVTKHALNIGDIVCHLLESGFIGVGIAPIYTTDNNLALSESDWKIFCEEFYRLSQLYLKDAIEGRYLGFSNMSNILKQLYKGKNTLFPCEAGTQYYTGDPEGNIYVCHRLVGRPKYVVGHLDYGINKALQVDFIKMAHIRNKVECGKCWARFLCGGGCYYDSVIKYNDVRKPVGSMCDRFRWLIDLGLTVYVTIMEKNPAFMNRLIGEGQLLC